MPNTHIITAIDQEIARLQQAKALLTSPTPDGIRRGPKPGPKPGPKRHLSPEARQRIAEGQKRRWAAARKRTT